MIFTRCDAPIGTLTLASDGAAITCLQFASYRGEPVTCEAGWVEDASVPVLREAVEQLGEYFAGTRTSFDLPLRPTGTTFQKSVWAALCQIPFGQTISYGELARRVGNPSASRAVGMANGRNPIAIVIPCHRVIGANGSLTGFGGGVEVKRMLLELEGSQAPSLLKLSAR